MDCRSCRTCGAHWMDGQLYWATGQKGNELDLAGLVCNQVDAYSPCNNPLRGQTGGQTWEQRQWELRRMDRFVEVALEEYAWSKDRFKNAEKDEDAA